MLSIRSLVESLGVFERNKVPVELKVLGLTFYISLRRIAKALSEIHMVFKTAVWKWVRKLGLTSIYLRYL
jgi:hypothetical protein